MKFKLKNIVLVSLLAVAGILGVSSALVNEHLGQKGLIEQANAWDDKWYVAGTFNSWSATANKMTKIDDSGNYEQWQFTYNFPANAEFKFVYNSSEWYTASLDAYSKAKSAITTPSNHKINSAGNYKLILKCEKGSSNKVLYYEQYTTVTLNKQSGTGGTSSVTAVYNTAMPSITAPTRDGYTFGGYYTGTNGSGTQYYNADGTSATNWNLIDTSKTLYAKWTVTVYTITYDRNKSSGLQATQSKTHGTNVTAYTPGTSPISASGWNASNFKRFIHWNTNYDDSGITYNAGATISSNSSFYLYYIEVWYSYRYRINSGSWVELVQNDEGKGADVQVQFAPSSAQTLPLNGIISFQYSDDGKSSWKDLTSVTFEGNYDTSTGIELATVDTIYLKITTSNTYVCWVPGLSDRTIAVFNSSSETTGGVPYSMRGNGDSETVTTEEVVIEKGQFVRRGYAGNYTFGSYFAGGTGTAASCFQQVGSDTAVECLKTGVYTVYNQKGGYDNWNDIYFTRNEAASAKYLAQQFNTIIAAICTDIVGGSKSLSNLQAVWGNVTSSTLYKYFNGQVSDTMAYFKTSSSTTDPDILACVTKYDYIENKYGTDALPDFIARNNGYKKSASRDLSPFALIGSEDNFSTIIIIISSSVALLSVTALSILVIRKRKSKEIE